MGTVESRAKDAGGSLSVFGVAGRIFSCRCTSGIHAVVLCLDVSSRLQVLDKFSFDTYGQTTAEASLAAFLNGLPHGRVVILGVTDSAVKNRATLGDDLEAALASLGGATVRGSGPGCVMPLRRLRYREAWAFAGVRGADAGSAVELMGRSRADAVRLKFHLSGEAGRAPTLRTVERCCLDTRSGQRQCVLGGVKVRTSQQVERSVPKCVGIKQKPIATWLSAETKDDDVNPVVMNIEQGVIQTPEAHAQLWGDTPEKLMRANISRLGSPEKPESRCASKVFASGETGNCIDLSTQMTPGRDVINSQDLRASTEATPQGCQRHAKEMLMPRDPKRPRWTLSSRWIVDAKELWGDVKVCTRTVECPSRSWA